MAIWNPFVGQQQPQAAQSSQPVPVPIITTADAKKFGLANFGNTCYANSVVQALYFCTPFRELLLQTVDGSISDIPPPPQNLLPPPPSPSVEPTRQHPERKPSTTNAAPEPASGPAPAQAQPIPTGPPTLFSALRSLYSHISSNPVEKGTVEPRAFIDKLKDLNELFRSNMQQDAHEFVMFLLNKIMEELAELKTVGNSEDLANSVATLSSTGHRTANSNAGTAPQDATLVHRLFEGILTSETRCLTCETVSSRDESFLDLSIDIEQNSSVSACLRQFSASEMLCQKNKFFCDGCCDLQEAEKRMKIKRLPNVLGLHLKRFKYQEDAQKYVKLTYRVAFPLELRLFNTVDDTDDADRLYELFGIVVHIGSGPHHGHYISIIKAMGHWLVFDDENVTSISESDIPKYFGDTPSGAAYVLYYQAVDIDLESLGLRSQLSKATYMNGTHTTSSLPSSTPPPSHPPGLVEEADSSDLSDPPFPPTPLHPSPLSSFEQDKKPEPLKIEVTPSGSVTTSPPPSPVKTPKTKASMPRLPISKNTLRPPPRIRSPSDTHEYSSLGGEQISSSPKFSSWFKVRPPKRSDSVDPEASSPVDSPVARNPSWFRSSAHRHEKKNRNSQKIEFEPLQTSTVQSDNTSTATGVYGSDVSPASASSLSQSSHGQSSIPPPLASPPPASFPSRRASHQSSTDGTPHVPAAPEPKRSLANLKVLHGKSAASSSLPARPATASDGTKRPPKGLHDWVPPLPSSNMGHHARPQSTTIADIAEGQTLDSFPSEDQGTAKRSSRLFDASDPFISEPQRLSSVPNSSQSSGSSSTPLSRAKRKLSITAPLLGFGKRDKHKSGPTS